MTRSYWQQNGRTSTYDIAVVGGGIIGCSTAYWLSRRHPDQEVALVEADTIGHGASGRNAGFLLQGVNWDYQSDVENYGEDTARRLWHITHRNRQLIEQELDPAAFDFVNRGGLAVAGTEEQDERLRASVPEMRAAGAPVAYLSPPETNRRLHADGFYGSLFVTSGAMLDPLQLVQHIAAESRATILEHHTVQRVEGSSGQVVIHTSQRTLEARRVVLAVGAYLPQLIPGVRRYVRPVRAQMLATAPAEESVLSLPVYSHAGEFYVRQTAEGTVLAGGARHRHSEAEVGYDDRTTPAVQADIERYLHTYFPWTQSLDISSRWSGTMGFSPDRRPVVGSLPSHSESLWVTGCTGHGMSYGFWLGRALASCAAGDRDVGDLNLFDSSRFQKSSSVSESKSSRLAP